MCACMDGCFLEGFTSAKGCMHMFQGTHVHGWVNMCPVLDCEPLW